MATDKLNKNRSENTDSHEEVGYNAQILVTSLTDMLDSMAMIRGNSSQKVLLEQAADMIRIFEAGYSSIQPRSVDGNEVESFAPGEHRGIFIRVTSGDGSQLGINVYGGIRDNGENETGQPNYAGYLAGRLTHARRTDTIAYKKQVIHFFVKSPHGESVTSCKLINDNNKEFRLTSLAVGQNKQKGQAVLPSNNHTFKNIQETIRQSVDLLSAKVQSSADPFADY